MLSFALCLSPRTPSTSYIRHKTPPSSGCPAGSISGHPLKEARGVRSVPALSSAFVKRCNGDSVLRQVAGFAVVLQTLPCHVVLRERTRTANNAETEMMPGHT
ncbi:hypothetical protein RRG08_000767 [Elysia crispata]|uniref:Uncharacterized protein n=1 Tax=Elysia crispata TaxID=231223 RepID=A0AAE1D139_9GAST|nr:hypothetical protein RRG08_000767 [Elysia crispata]